MNGKLLVIGFGPGSFEHITKRAKDAIEESDCVIGYKTYVQLIRDLLTSQDIVSTGMSEEVSRAHAAVNLAEEGKKVAVISSGDAGVYGMAGLVYEVLVEKGWKEESGIEVEIIPGISAINSCASLLGAPVMHDACTISLSDHLTPWKIIEKRIEAAAQADFVISLYNPKSGKRTRQIVETQKIILKYRSPDTPVGLVKSAYRDRQNVVITNLKEMLDYDIGMLTTVIIGNSTTFLYDNKLITPRGYQRKYTLNTAEQSLKPHERLRKENEPWALHNGKKEENSSLDFANEAVQKIDEHKGVGSASTPSQPVDSNIESIFELAVSPGVANKKFTPEQLRTLAEVAGEGTMEYTPHHQILLEIPTSNPQEITSRLQEVDLLISPVGDVLQVKACDFCDGEKKDAIPYAEELQAKLGGLDLPKELKLGVNGCGMACYGAVKDDIGIVYRKGKFDLFLGAKTVGRTAHPGQPVAEGIEPDKIVDLLEKIIQEFKEKGHPNEKFYKFFKRVGDVQGFKYKNVTPKIEVEPAPCGE
ncbi:precorrin-3B C17-methyltransferase [Thalassobacillus cyri]|uniref:Precorrin-3B C17-methyltransferase n=1 Tax=Thalassobacillus cyri TaxID=571932 RepID=A0A1H4GX29_9BACI|nr:precorrin-3B C(17)-methyltransferase [Thalassobacillus cyri]SEB13660.1 precorrin-3B C17-methyltransferase [Thalassobacillus cyri]